MKILDQNTWKRKEHYAFFKACDDPYYGVTLEIDVTKAYEKCKALDISFSLYYHYLSTKALNEIEEFRFRIKGEDIVIFDKTDVTTILLRPDKTFVIAYVPFVDSFEEFCLLAKAEFEKMLKTTGIGLTEDIMRLNTIHYSAMPWLNFKSLSHPLKIGAVKGNPRISFGKAYEINNKRLMSVAVHAHHGFVDGFHIGAYIDTFQTYLDE